MSKKVMGEAEAMRPTDFVSAANSFVRAEYEMSGTAPAENRSKRATDRQEERR